MASNYIDKGSNFSSMLLDKRVVRAVSRLSFSHPTVVQVNKQQTNNKQTKKQKKKKKRGGGGGRREEGGGGENGRRLCGSFLFLFLFLFLISFPFCPFLLVKRYPSCS